MTVEVQGVRLPDLPMMRLGQYLRFVISPALELEVVDDTVLAKVHTPDLRVVFNNQARDRFVKDLIPDESRLIVSPWPVDVVTRRSLVDNVKIHP